MSLSIVAQSKAGHAEHGGFLGDADDLPLGIDQRIDNRRNLHEMDRASAIRSIGTNPTGWHAGPLQGNSGDDVMAYL